MILMVGKLGLMGQNTMNDAIIIKGGKLYTEKGSIQGYTALSARNGKIVSLNEAQCLDSSDVEYIELPDDAIIIPGMIDVHTHGALGVDMMDGTVEALDILCKTLPREGVTSFLATTMSESSDKIERAIQNVGECIQKESRGAEIIGIHLEGPFISKSKCGAQNPQHLLVPDIVLFEKWQRICKGSIRIVTIAPELEGAINFIKYLKDQGVIASIGHTNANHKQALEAYDAGASHCTHCFNAMTGVHHREPGVVGVALTTNLNIELIADGVHINPHILHLAYLAKSPERIILITDAMRGKYLDDGVYSLGGQEVMLKQGAAYLKGTQTLAGSTLALNEGLRNMMNATGATIDELVKMTSSNAAKELGIYPQKGSLSLGSDADITVLDKNYNVLLTLCRGKLCYLNEVIRQTTAR